MPQKQSLKPSLTGCRKRGKGEKLCLRLSKSSDEHFKRFFARIIVCGQKAGINNKEGASICEHQKNHDQ
jgi:hypothetical protein